MRMSKDDFLKADDLAPEEIDLSDLPGYTGTVLVRGLTGRQRDEFEASIMERRGKQMVPNVANIRAKLIAKCVVDEDGERLFSDADAEALGAKSAAALDRIYETAARLSGLSDEDVEEMAENFGGEDSGGSPSPLPGTSGKAARNSSPR